MIMAAGLGTRLKPWTLSHPKALVPVEGVPVLERLILKLRDEGFEHIVVNVHHFSDQIKDFLASRDWGIDVRISDETDRLLDTGGALRKAYGLLSEDNGPVLVHNVDILSNQDLGELIMAHNATGADITLLTSDRNSSRRLLFDSDGYLRGWHNLKTGEYRPADIENAEDMVQDAFSGIYVISPKALADISEYGVRIGADKFPIMDYLLSAPEGIAIKRHFNLCLRLLDIGKPESLACANEYLK